MRQNFDAVHVHGMNAFLYIEKHTLYFDRFSSQQNSILNSTLFCVMKR